MQKFNNLYLFTEKFPYKGGEPFLETEIEYLANSFEKITILPNEIGDKLAINLPQNVGVENINFSQNISLKKVLKSHFLLILNIYTIELLKSPQRLKYIQNFKANFYHLIGLINEAIQLKNAVKLDVNNTYYTYWFAEWTSRLIIIKKMGINIEIITRAHGYDFDEQQQNRRYHLFRYSEMKWLKSIIQVSNYGKKYITFKFKDADNISVSYLGVAKQIKENLLVKNEVYQIVSCSNFVALKRVYLIAEILQYLNVPYHWTHFGDSIEKIDVEQKIEKIISPLNYTFKGFIANKDLMTYYQTHSVDLFINVSELEGLPVSLMEAISFGIPVVGCNICGVPEIVTNETGILLDKNFSPNEAAKKIEQFLSLPLIQIESFRKGIKLFWENYFNADKNYPEFIKKYLLN